MAREERKIQRQHSNLSFPLTHTATGNSRPVLDTATYRGFESYRGTRRRIVKHKNRKNTRDFTEGNAVIRHMCRTRLYIRDHENDEYLKESSVERILDHDSNTREKGSTETHRRATCRSPVLKRRISLYPVCGRGEFEVILI